MATAVTKVDPVGLASQLIDAGHADTVYRDIYLQRAWTLLGGVFSVEEFRRTEEAQAELARLPLAIGRALEKADWPRVKELSDRGQALRRSVEGRRREMEAARGVYAVTDVRLDPFSPGLQPFTRIAGKGLLALRDRAVARLGALEQADAPWKDYYSQRRSALQALALSTSEQAATATEGASIDIREAAERALKQGDMRGLAKLAETRMTAVTPAKRRADPAAADGGPNDGGARAVSGRRHVLLGGDCERGAPARPGPRRLESRAELASLRQYVWNPLVADESGRIGAKQVPLPAGTPEAFRDRLEMLMIHPIVNSGGARHLPKLVAEDVLVEDFADPKAGEQPPESPLITALGFSSRLGLSRIAIEQALLARGAGVLEKELGLDPRAFRLVCIPPDVHLRLGEAEGWGRQPFWTHFDGYLVMADGRVRALAGGDARFGGLYDLVGLSRDYDSDRVMARFAVVRRERMVAW